MNPTYILVCRSAFCLKCYQRESPKRYERFVVFGTTSQDFKLRTVHDEALRGFTPHLYTIEYPFRKTESGLVIVNRCCTMNGCGLEIGKKKPDGRFAIHFLEAQEHELHELSVDALIKLWVRTGYELL